MAAYDEELVAAARHLLRRRAGQRGKLPQARLRRSISTAHYALFHFLTEDAVRRIIGAPGGLQRRRRTLSRAFTHTGMKVAFDKVRGPTVDGGVADLLRPPGISVGAVASPMFAREMARAFSDAHAKRTDADYDLNKPISEPDALLLLERVEGAISVWRAARSPADRDFKHALCLLMLLKGQVRRETTQ